MPETYEIAVSAGDGIGNEVVPPGQEVLEAAGRRHGFALKWSAFDWSHERYVKTDSMMPTDSLDQLRRFDAIFLGAAGYLGVTRSRFSLEASDSDPSWFRPVHQSWSVRSMAAIEGVLRPPLGDNIDFCVVRENTEGDIRPANS